MQAPVTGESTVMWYDLMNNTTPPRTAVETKSRSKEVGQTVVMAIAVLLHQVNLYASWMRLFLLHIQGAINLCLC